MEFNVEVQNPILVGAMQLFKAEDTPEHRKLFMNELAKARLMSPVFIDPEPTVSPEGKYVVEKGAKVVFPQINTKDGKKFFVLYTDKNCMDKAIDVEGNPTPEMFRKNFAALQLDEIGAMMLVPMPDGGVNPVEGVVLNPFDENIIVGKETAIGLFKHKVDVLKKSAEKPI